MFDWPEPSHTSPTSTSLMVRVFFPFTPSVCGPPAGSLSNRTTHLPSAAALAARLPRDADRHLLARVGPAPDGNGVVPLENHVVRDHGGQLHVGAGGGRRSEQEGGKQYVQAHRVPRLTKWMAATVGAGQRSQPKSACRPTRPREPTASSRPAEQESPWKACFRQLRQAVYPLTRGDLCRLPHLKSCDVRLCHPGQDEYGPHIFRCITYFV